MNYIYITLGTGLISLLPNFSILSGLDFASNFFYVINPARYWTIRISSACPSLLLRQGFTPAVIIMSSQVSCQSPLKVFNTVPDVLNFCLTLDFPFMNYFGECDTARVRCAVCLVSVYVPAPYVTMYYKDIIMKI